MSRFLDDVLLHATGIDGAPVTEPLAADGATVKQWFVQIGEPFLQTSSCQKTFDDTCHGVPPSHPVCYPGNHHHHTLERKMTSW